MNGQIWKYYLNNKNKDSLLNSFDYDQNTLVICQKLENCKYGIFNSYANFKKYVRQNVKPEENCFYECILNKHSRKPYFDIDIKNKTINGDNLIKNLKIVLKNILNKYNYTTLVYTSHTETKQSYHVILHGVFFSSNKELISFYNKVKEIMEIEYKEYLDPSVYTEGRQFRLLGSRKFNKNNTKIIDENLSDNVIIPKYYSTEIAKDNYNFGISLICNITDCVMITDFMKTPSPRRYIGYHDDKIVDEVEDILTTKYDDLFDIDKVVNNGLITLKKNRPYKCFLCNRVHESENPFVIIRDIGGIEKSVEFYCRRYQAINNKWKTIILGKINNIKTELTRSVPTRLKHIEDLEPNLESKIENLRKIEEHDRYDLNDSLKRFKLF